MSTERIDDLGKSARKASSRSDDMQQKVRCETACRHVELKLNVSHKGCAGYLEPIFHHGTPLRESDLGAKAEQQLGDVTSHIHQSIAPAAYGPALTAAAG